MKEYKVISMKDRWLWGRLDTEKATLLLNAETQCGWRVVSVCANGVWGFGRHRDELVAVLERERL